MVPKSQKKTKPSAAKETKGSHHRAAQKENKEGYACPVCWAVPPTIRNDGVSTARHEPASSGAEKFRDTVYCNGQGQVARYVLDKNWKPGHEPQNSITAKEYEAYGTDRFEERQKRRAEKETRKSAPRQKREPKAAKKAKPSARPKRQPKPKAQEAEDESVQEQEASSPPAAA